MSDSKPTIYVKVDALGRGTVLVDGQDISRHVTSVSISSRPGDVTQTTLELFGDVEAEVLGIDVLIDNPSNR